MGYKSLESINSTKLNSMSSNSRWFLDTQYSSSFKAEHEKKFVLYTIELIMINFKSNNLSKSNKVIILYYTTYTNIKLF